MIFYKTNMQNMPKNCKECQLQFCTLPLKKNKDEIKKEYESKKHAKCPLIES